MLNEYVYMIPAFFILAGIVFCTVNRLEPDSPFLLWSGILAGFYFIYSMLWESRPQVSLGLGYLLPD
ncbi:MAG: hypothetical protein ACOX5R_01160 [bacterium]